MKILILTLIISLNSVWASPLLKVGDILLQPTDCWSCSLIEAEEESIYSHLGIVLQVKPEVLVAESLGRVRLVSFEEFNRKTEKGLKLGILRFNNEKLVNYMQENSEPFMKLFKKHFEDLPYDHDFLWNNFDEFGNQKFYCSEMVAKLLQAFVQIDPPMKRMHFSRYPEQWERYFRGKVPVGEWGNSPADFERSPMFHIEGHL